MKHATARVPWSGNWCDRLFSDKQMVTRTAYGMATGKAKGMACKMTYGGSFPGFVRQRFVREKSMYHSASLNHFLDGSSNVGIEPPECSRIAHPLPVPHTVTVLLLSFNR